MSQETASSSAAGPAQSNTNAPAPAPQPAPAKTWRKDCTVLFGGWQGPVVASSVETIGCKIGAKLVAGRYADANPHLALVLAFPFGSIEKLEERGFGVPHSRDAMSRMLVPTNTHVVEVRVPRGRTKFVLHAADSGIIARFPALAAKPDKVTLVEIQLADGTESTVVGFGKPFANDEDDEVEGWVNANKPIVDGHTILDVLRQRTFYVVVPETRAVAERVLVSEESNGQVQSFEYPYGRDHKWDMGRYLDQFKHIKGHQFTPPASFDDDDNAQVTAVTQACVQDILWLVQEAAVIAEREFPAYFVPRSKGGYFAILTPPQSFHKEHESAMNRLVQDCPLVLKGQGSDGKWTSWKDAYFVDHPDNFPELDPHNALDAADIVVAFPVQPQECVEPETDKLFESRQVALQAGKEH